MVWRDLDLYIRAPGIGAAEYFVFGGRVTQLRITRVHRAADNRVAVHHHGDQTAYWTDPRYRDTVTSTMIYEAVLTAGVKTPEQFERQLG